MWVIDRADERAFRCEPIVSAACWPPGFTMNSLEEIEAFYEDLIDNHGLERRRL